MVIKFTAATNPAGKLADAEIHFQAPEGNSENDGAIGGLKLIGFGIWARRAGTGYNVTFPARSYAINGERRSFALLRPIADHDAQNRLRDLILEAFAAWYETTIDPGIAAANRDFARSTRVED